MALEVAVVLAAVVLVEAVALVLVAVVKAVMVEVPILAFEMAQIEGVVVAA